jgi:hypothetical protein
MNEEGDKKKKKKKLYSRVLILNIEGWIENEFPVS